MAGWPAVTGPRIVIAVLSLALVTALVVSGSSSTADFSIYNTDWDGTSNLRSSATIITQDTEVYDRVEPGETIAIILSPDSPYTTEERERLRRFVTAGGTLVVAEDFGPHTNALLESLGARSRIDGQLLRDEWNHFNSPALPYATELGGNELVSGIDQLTLNYGTVVQANNATVIARSSDLAYLDSNLDSLIDERESLGSYPVVTYEELGAGRLFVVSDPSIFVNRMLEQPGNQQFVGRLVTERQTVLLDYSHVASVPPLTQAILLVRGSSRLQLVLGLAAIAAVAIFSTRRLRRERERDSPIPPTAATDEAVAAYLKKRHPTWDTARVERLLENLKDPGPPR
ncbi:DUF4350 domain-containing protein [Haladaptatus sp. DYSN1]|uniref:DUF4350 domain-containing protein n=1 Tax=unclassified Haladaptatus TaxID=2622732 RepID=UPI00240724D5|nr:DUF4350 domain-containing protein [Haladaptatus sp. DYSN1]